MAEDLSTIGDAHAETMVQACQKFVDNIQVGYSYGPNSLVVDLISSVLLLHAKG